MELMTTLELWLRTIEAQEYAKIWDYAEMVKTCDAGSHVVIKCDASMEGRAPIFNRIYIRFNAQKVGFLGGCRPFVCLDALFLKGPFGGHMIMAVGRDGNDNIFPIAIAIVKSECSDSWHWFLQIFKEDIGNGEAPGLLFISNKQKGVDDALIDLFPTCEQRYCMKHLYENFRKKFAGQELKDAMWQIANATTRREWENKVNAMKDLSEEAWQWLLNIPPPQWCKSRFGTRGKCDALVNNTNESFKDMVSKARALPIISLLEWYRICLMKRFNLKREGIMNYAGDICPNILKRLEKTSTMARDYLAIAAGANMYEVGNGFERHVVNLNAKTGTCRLWELQGLPCRHGVAAILHNGQRPTEYVHDCYKRDAFRAAYQAIISPMPGREQWPKTGITLMPPNIRQQPVRLKESRKRRPDEPRDQNTASRRKG